MSDKRNPKSRKWPWQSSARNRACLSPPVHAQAWPSPRPACWKKSVRTGRGRVFVLRGFPGGLDSASVGCGRLSPGPGAVHSSLSTLAALFTDAPPSSSAARASPALYSLVCVTHIRNFGHRSLSFAEPVACCPPVGWQLRGLGHSTKRPFLLKGKELLEEN